MLRATTRIWKRSKINISIFGKIIYAVQSEIQKWAELRRRCTKLVGVAYLSGIRDATVLDGQVVNTIIVQFVPVTVERLVAIDVPGDLEINAFLIIFRQILS